MTISWLSAPIARTWRRIQLVERAILEPDRERLQRPIDESRHQDSNRAAVDTAGQEHPERHVAHQPQADRFFEQARKRGTTSFDAIDESACLQAHPSTGESSSRSPDEREGRQVDLNRTGGRTGIAQDLGEDRRVGDRFDQFARQNRLDLGAKQQRIARARPVQRLDAEPIAHEQKALSAHIPEREREHPAEPLHTVVAPLLVRVDDRFRVALGPVLVAVLNELASSVGVVVDFAVEQRPRSCRLRWRAAAGQCSDRRC
jgi:hypothetical protein